MPTRQDNRPPKGARPFTGREDKIECFWSLFHHIGDREYNVLSFYGVGGVGKTRLRQELINQVRSSPWGEETVVSSVLDFDTRDNRPSLRDVERALFALRNELRRQGVQFRSFDIAYAHYWEMTHPEVALQQKDIPFINEGSAIIDLFGGGKDLIELLQDFSTWIVGAGMLPKALTLIKFLNKAGRDWLTKRAIERLQRLNTVGVGKLLDELIYFLAHDIRAYQEKSSDRRFVFFLDTYEALWWETSQNRSVANWLGRDQWIRDLVAEVPNTLWIISGRNRLRWSEIDDWGEFVDEVLMGELSETDAERYLTDCGLTYQAIIQRIIISSRGLPFALELQVDQYEHILRTRQPVIDDFTENPNDLIQRFIEYLELPEIKTLEILSVARVWNPALFLELIRHFQTGYPGTALSELSQFSFITMDGIRYRMHSLMGEELRNRIDWTLQAECNQFLFQYYNRKLEKIDPKFVTQEQEFAFEEAFYHKLHLDSIKQVTHWFVDRWKVFDYGQYWSAGLRIALDIQEKWIISEENIQTEEFSKLLSIIGLILYNQSQFARALESHKQSLEICQLIYDKNHLDTAKALNDIGTTYNRLGSYADALKFHHQALKIRQEKLGINHADTAISLNDIGVDYIKQGRYSNALEYLHQALKIKNMIYDGTHPETARTLNNIGNVYKRQGKYTDALDCHYQALKNRQLVLGMNHPDIAKSYYNIGSVYKRQGKYVDALNYHRQALEIRQLVLGEEHFDTIKSKKWVKYITFLMKK